MSGGRYTLAELYDENAEWRVIYNDSGLARTPASLSGGEEFIASLALGLGMVEMMAPLRRPTGIAVAGRGLRLTGPLQPRRCHRSTRSRHGDDHSHGQPVKALAWWVPAGGVKRAPGKDDAALRSGLGARSRR